MSNQKVNAFPEVTIVATSHEGPEGRHVLLEVTSTAVQTAEQPDLRIAIALDKSGSMSGPKLEISKAAIVRFIHSLGARDQVGVISFDSEVATVCPLGVEPNWATIQVQNITTGGSTNLYGGWLTACKMLNGVGRVIVVSDGQANHGRFTQADDLARNAKHSRRAFHVSTSTIGVGDDYDEELMAKMATAGEGAHYFAKDAAAIMDALGRERYSVSAETLSDVQVVVGQTTVSLGRFWQGETKKQVIPVSDLGVGSGVITLSATGNAQRMTYRFDLPDVFGTSHDLTLELILQEAAQGEEVAADVRDKDAASRTIRVIRAVLLKLLAHPLSNSGVAQASKASLENTLNRLQDLERHFDEGDASIHRKRSRQTSYNYTERAKAYSSRPEDAAVNAMLMDTARSKLGNQPQTVDPSTKDLLTKAQWLAWPALPYGTEGERLFVQLVDQTHGFVIAEIEKATGKRVQPLDQSASPESIRLQIEGLYAVNSTR